MFIDLHCHILPQIDDGADSLIEACEIIEQAVKNGTKVITATPHYNNKDVCASQLNRSTITETYRELKKFIEEKNIQVSIFLGCELLADSNLSGLYKNKELIPINGSRYILTEFDFNEKFKNIIKYCKKLLNYGFIPLIAHPERYTVFSESFENLYLLLNLGCRFQINKGSPLGNHGDSAQIISIRMLNEDLVHVIASDCHSPGNRNADMSEIYEWLLNRYPLSKIKDWTHDNAKRILLDLNI